MRFDLTHSEETDHSLESWSTDLQGVHLTVDRVLYDFVDPNANYETFIWHNNLTGKNYHSGRADSLAEALSEAINTVITVTEDE